MNREGDIKKLFIFHFFFVTEGRGLRRIPTTTKQRLPKISQLSNLLSPRQDEFCHQTNRYPFVGGFGERPDGLLVCWDVWSKAWEKGLQRSPTQKVKTPHELRRQQNKHLTSHHLTGSSTTGTNGREIWVSVEEKERRRIGRGKSYEQWRIRSGFLSVE